MPSRLRLAAAAAVLAAPTVLAFFSGGYFGVVHGQVGVLATALAWVLVAAVLLLEPRPLPDTRAGQVALGGLAALVAWSAVSLLWSPLLDPGLADVERASLYLAAFVVGCAALRGPAITRAVEPSLLAGVAIVCAYALATRLLPDIVHATSGTRAGSRLDQPLTYWNAMGALAGMGLMLAIHTASDARRAQRLRIAAMALVPALGLTLFLTVSRGAHLAAIAGAAVIVLAARNRRALDSTILGVALVTVTAGLGSLFSGVVELAGSMASRERQGLAVLAILLAACGLAALGQAALVRLEARGLTWTEALRRRRLLAALAAAAALAVVVLGVAAFAGGDVKPAPRDALAQGTERFRTLETNRWRYWRVALDTFAEEPLTGSGIHGFAREWLERRDIDEGVQDAHSLYVETLTELGLPGFLFLGLFLGAVAIALWRAGEPGWVAASAVWAIHAGVDWDWEMPSLTLVFIALAAAATATAASTQSAGSAANRNRVTP
jgi:O-antigen ligase